MDTSFLAQYLLYQTHLSTMCLVGCAGVILFLLKVAFPSEDPRGKMSVLLGAIALILVLVFAFNIGWFARDKSWGCEQVQQDRQTEVQRLNNELKGK
ncbi:MAG: hypothetical protein PHY34_03450 [Patescibacteria group bacterium]|nr:hypothetical protein [Patescibacteria group bacterium]MDD5715661.1 hypothetical protein [Patescibacteria group bacterium]